MKTIRLLAAFAGVSIATSSFAVPALTPTAPVPASVINPTRLPLSFRGGIVTVDFRLDANGKPHDIRVRSAQDAELARRIKTAFSQWTFASAPDQPRSPEARFVLPLEIKL